jgi:uncharacterized membrane protein
MNKGRLEAFSDGVIAIIITIMVLEIDVPHGSDLRALQPVLPLLLGYALSFVYVGIYWNNHHHLLAGVQRIDGRVLWPNLHLLFGLSLIPLATEWAGESYFAMAPLAAYGVVLLMASLAFRFLQNRLIIVEGPDSVLAHAVKGDWKGTLSAVAYCCGIGASFWQPWIAGSIYVVVALGWLVPDQRIERTLAHRRATSPHT